MIITTDSESFIRTVIISQRPTLLLVGLGIAPSAAEVKKRMKSGQLYHSKGNPPIFWPVLRDHKIDISDGDIIQYNGKKVQINFASFKIEVDTVEVT